MSNSKIESQFYYPVTLSKGDTNAIKLYAPWVQTLTSLSANDVAVAVLTLDSGNSPQGLYVWTGKAWRFVVPLPTLSSWVLYGYTTYIYIAPQAPIPVAGGAFAYLNGQPLNVDTIPASPANTYAMAVPVSDFGPTGNMVIGQNLTFDNNVLSAPDQPTGNMTIGTNLTLVNNVLSAPDQPTGNMTIGSNLTLNNNVLSAPAATSSQLGVVSPAPNGGLTVNAGELALTPATATKLGGVYVPSNSGLTLSPDGKLVNAGVLSINGQNGAVMLTPQSVGLPNDLLSGPGGTLATTYIPAGLLGAVQYKGTYNAVSNTPAITTGSASAGNKGFYYLCSLGGNVSIDGITHLDPGDWVISDGNEWTRVPGNSAVSSVNGLLGAVVIRAVDQNAASGTSLISDDGALTGIIKLRSISAGNGVTLALDPYNNIQLSAALTSVNGQEGDVVIKAQPANNASGVSLIEDSGATTGLIKLLNLVAGTGMGFSTDANGNLVLTSTVTGGVSEVSGQTGNVTVEAVQNNNASGTSLIADSGATTGVIKLLNIVAGVGIGIDADANGNIRLTSTAVGGVSKVSGQTGDVVVEAVDNNTASGTSLISDNGATTGIIKMLRLVGGSNVNIDTDTNGNIRINSSGTSYTLSPATATTLGGVQVPASSAVSVDGSGNLGVKPATAAALGAVIVPAASGMTVDGTGNLGLNLNTGLSIVSNKLTYTLSVAKTNAIGGVQVPASSGMTVDASGIIGLNLGTGLSIVNNQLVASAQALAPATTTVLGGVIVPAASALTVDGSGNLGLNLGSGLSISGGKLVSTATGGVANIVVGASNLNGNVTLSGSGTVQVSVVNGAVSIAGTGVGEAPFDSNSYVRNNGTWVQLPSIANAITSVTGPSVPSGVNMVQSGAPANSAIIKSLVAGNNVTLTDDGLGHVTIAAAVNSSNTVTSVNGITPTSGNVNLTASNVGAVPLAGNVTMTGPLNFGGNTLTGIADAVNNTDAVNLETLKALSIDGGVIG